MASPANEPRERREIRYAGHVQGVGFRYTTRTIATRFDVAGYVQNLRDGRVLVVVEGTPATVDQFLAAVEGELVRYIRSRDVATVAAANEFTDFEIRF
jgi:acylphosphatase